MSDSAKSLQELFISQARKRLKYVLREHPELEPSIERHVDGLAKAARFDLVDTNPVRHPRKRVLRFVEIVARRVRRANIRSEQEFRDVWASVGGTASNFCREVFKKLDPLVHC